MNEAHESQFDQFGQLILGKPRRPSRLNHFDPIEVSGGLNRKLAGLAGGSPRFAYSMGPTVQKLRRRAGKSNSFGIMLP